MFANLMTTITTGLIATANPRNASSVSDIKFIIVEEIDKIIPEFKSQRILTSNAF